MEWNKPAAYQVPGGQPPASRRQYDDSDEQETKDGHEASPGIILALPDRHGLQGALQISPPPIPSLKAELSFGNNVLGLNNSALTLHGLNSLEMQHLDEGEDFPQLFPTPHSEHQPHNSFTPPNQQHYAPPSSQFAQPLSVMPGFYGMQALTALQGVHETMDYFSEGFQGFHGCGTTPTISTTPTLPASFGSQQQQLRGFEDRSGEFNDAQTMFNSSLATQSPVTIASCPAVAPLSSYTSLQEVNRNVPPLGEPAPFPGAELPIESGPKFSPDRRKLCCVEGCKSQARAFNRCKRHGGSKRCSHPGCTKSVQSRGLCIRHGGGSRCQESGCTRASQSHGKCKMHGGGRPCIVAGCDKKAHLKRLCRKHGGGAKCSVLGCEKWAQRQGMCMTHSKTTRPPVLNSVDASTAGSATGPASSSVARRDRGSMVSPAPPTPRGSPSLQSSGPSSTYMPA